MYFLFIYQHSSSNFASRKNTSDDVHLTLYESQLSTFIIIYIDSFYNIGLSRFSKRVLLLLLHLLNPFKNAR